MEPIPELMTVAEAASRLSVTPSTLKRWRLAGTGPAAIMITDRLVRYRPSAVEAWLKARTTGGGVAAGETAP